MSAHCSGHQCATHPLYSKKTQRNHRTRCCWSQLVTGRCRSARPSWCWSEPGGASAMPHKPPSLLVLGHAAPGCPSPPNLWAPQAGRDLGMDCQDSDLSSGPATCHHDKNKTHHYCTWPTLRMPHWRKAFWSQNGLHRCLVLRDIPRNKDGVIPCNCITWTFNWSKFYLEKRETEKHGSGQFCSTFQSTGIFPSVCETGNMNLLFSIQSSFTLVSKSAKISPHWVQL